MTQQLPECNLLSDGSSVWILGGRFHCETGPAREYPDGQIEWWLEGNRYPFFNWLKRTSVSDEEKVMLKLIYG